MVICKKCNVHINTAVKKCPLCQNELEDDGTFGNFDSNVFPYVESIKKNGLWKKVLGIIFLTAIVLCTCINVFNDHKLSWSLYVDFSIICIHASIAIGLKMKRSLSSILFYEYIFVCLACFLWDKYTGMLGWSLNYVLPTLSSLYIIANFVLRIVFKKHFIKYFRNIFIASIGGILCMVLYLNSISTIYIPSLISFIIGCIAILCMLILDSRKILVELNKRLHI